MIHNLISIHKFVIRVLLVKLGVKNEIKRKILFFKFRVNQIIFCLSFSQQDRFCF
jgi:hypothetical protein